MATTTRTTTTKRPSAAKPTAKKTTTTTRTASRTRTTTPYIAEATKPFFAYVGAGDLAIAVLRTLPATAKEWSETVLGQAKETADQARDFPSTLPGTLKSLPTRTQTQATKIAEQATELREQLQALPSRVQHTVVELQDKALETYSDLAVRGEKLVTSIRQQGSSQQATRAAKSTVAQVKGVRTTAGKTAAATAQAASTAAKKVGEGPSTSL